MTLNDKFDKATDGWIVADACEEIADDYAIEFAVWIETSEWNIKYWLQNNNTKELLQMFKKEKGL